MLMTKVTQALRLLFTKVECTVGKGEKKMLGFQNSSSGLFNFGLCSTELRVKILPVIVPSE